MKPWLVGLMLALAVLTGCGAARPDSPGSGTDTAPPPTVPTAPVPDQGPPPPLPGASVEEQIKWKQEFNAWAEANGRIIHVSGPETKGSKVEVAGREVQLPPDAYVDAFITNIDCLPGTPCPQPPVYRLKRGNSMIAFERNSGIVLERFLAPGEEQAFAFLGL